MLLNPSMTRGVGTKTAEDAKKKCPFLAGKFKFWGETFKMELLWLLNSESSQFFLLIQDLLGPYTDVVIVVILSVLVTSNVT